jgi:hypothetical protein
MSRHYTILQSDVTDLGFFDELQDALDQLRATTGLTFSYAFSDEPADRLARHVYRERNDRAVLTLVEDHATPVRYLITEAPTREEVRRVASALEQSLPSVPVEELQRDAAEPGRRPEGLVLLALGADEAYDEASANIIRDALGSDDPVVRLKAVEASSLTLWSELMLAVEAARDSDPDPRVRELATRALSGEWGRREHRDEGDRP